MGNQARQRQDIELWQVVSPARNENRIIENRKPGRARTAGLARQGRARMADPVRAGRARMADPVRAGRVRTADPVRAGRVRTAAPVRQGRVRTADDLVRRKKAKTRASVQSVKRREARRRQMIAYRCFAILWMVVMIMAIIFIGKVFYNNFCDEQSGEDIINYVIDEIPVFADKSDDKKPEMLEDFLTISEYNRPGTNLTSVKNIFVHYTANPGTSAAQNRSYFQNLGETHERAASAHFIIGYEGEIIQCIPLEEEAYAVVDRNNDSISIECCFINEDGSFTQETYDSLIAMLAWLTDKYDLEAKDILRHYDCGGKLCPVYYVEHEDAWEKLLHDVENYKL